MPQIAFQLRTPPNRQASLFLAQASSHSMCELVSTLIFTLFDFSLTGPESLPQQTFTVQGSQTIFDLKCLLHGRSPHHPADQRLIHLGRELENHKKLSDYTRIQDGATLLLVLRPRDVRKENLWGLGTPLNKMLGRAPDT